MHAGRREGRGDDLPPDLNVRIPRSWLFLHRWTDGGHCPKTNVPLVREEIGGRSAPAWERVGRLGDGWLVSQATPAEVAEGIAAIRASAAKHGRVVEDDHYGVMLPVYLAATHDEAAANAVFAGPARQRADAPLDQFAAPPLTPPPVLITTKAGRSAVSQPSP